MLIRYYPSIRPSILYLDFRLGFMCPNGPRTSESFGSNHCGVAHCAPGRMGRSKRTQHVLFLTPKFIGSVNIDGNQSIEQHQHIDSTQPTQPQTYAGALQIHDTTIQKLVLQAASRAQAGRKQGASRAQAGCRHARQSNKPSLD